MSTNTQEHSHVLPDTKQSFWQLAFIQLTGVTSLPVLFASIILVQKTSLFNSIIVLLVANFILWIIRYGLIAMSYHGRKSVMDIAEDYFGSIWGLGKWGIYLIAALLLLSTTALFVEETTIVSSSLTSLFSINEGPGIDPFLQISVIIGIISTIFCTQGMVALRWLSTIALPLILASFVILLIAAPSNGSFIAHSALSLSMLPFVLGINLAITADLPTFFRHSKSWKDAMFGLTALQLTSLAIGIGGLFLGSMILSVGGIPTAGNDVVSSELLKFAFVALVAFSSICSNVSNVYSASVGWELFAPTALVGKKEYLILGFLLTLVFISVTGEFSMNFLLNITNAALVNLSFVFILGYFVHLLTKRHLDRADRTAYFLAWLVPTIVNICQYSNIFLSKQSVLLVSLCLTVGIVCLSLVRKSINR